MDKKKVYAAIKDRMLNFVKLSHIGVKGSVESLVLIAKTVHYITAIGIIGKDNW